MKSKKCLGIGMLLFNLPDDFQGTRSDAIRLLADFLDATEESPLRTNQKIHDLDNKPFKEIEREFERKLLQDSERRLTMIDVGVYDYEEYNNRLNV